MTPEPLPAESLPAGSPLVVRDLTKRYEDHLAVDRLSFRVGIGEILGLVGPNGAGKTTTLRSIAGILPLQEGRVTVAGYDIVTEEARAKASLVWVPDDPQPFDALTVAEHLRFTAELYGLRGWKARAAELLERFELADRRDSLGGELSRGMRQKLAFCCAWLPCPSVVLLDEPLSGLDPRGIRSAKRAIRELASEGTAVILSSHLLELIEELSARFLILSRGRKAFEGTLAEARTSLATHAGSTLEEIFLAVTEGHDLEAAIGLPAEAPGTAAAETPGAAGAPIERGGESGASIEGERGGGEEIERGNGDGDAPGARATDDAGADAASGSRRA